jgi:hypothetical protein
VAPSDLIPKDSVCSEESGKSGNGPRMEQLCVRPNRGILPIARIAHVDVLMSAKECPVGLYIPPARRWNIHHIHHNSAHSKQPLLSTPHSTTLDNTRTTFSFLFSNTHTHTNTNNNVSNPLDSTSQQPPSHQVVSLPQIHLPCSSS